MESGNGEITKAPGVRVKVSTNNCLKEIGNKIKTSVEDNNRNLTHCSNSMLANAVEFDSSPKHVSYNGPNGMINGVSLDKFDVQFNDNADTKNSSNNCSSPCEKLHCEDGVSDCSCDKTDSDRRDLKFALDCKKALQELILDSGQICCQGKTIDYSSPADSQYSMPNDSNFPGVNERLSDSQSLAFKESTSSASVAGCSQRDNEIGYVSYENEHQMPDIMRLIQKDLSEPYSIYTYRYFIHKWPQLCFLAVHGDKCVGAIVCKLDIHRKVIRRGYIAMLAVDEKYRKRKIGTNLVLKAIRAMVADNADEIVLETEITNNSALCLYENLGFVRDKRLFRYYLNGVDALRLKLWLR